MDKRAFYRDPRVAGSYEDRRSASPAGRLAQELELAAVRRAFGPREKVVELACGTGRLMRTLLGEGWDVRGIDQSPEMLAAGGGDAGGRLLVGDVFRLPLPDRAADGLFCFRFTNHYAELGGFFRECSRVLRPGGTLVCDSMRWSPLLWDSPRLGGRNHCAADRRIAAWLEEAGFAVESVEPLFPIGPYLLGRLPLALARLLLGGRGLIPARLQAVAVWLARRR
ncbi:MAG: class I SAM-dependent methyltransferase [Elusimicrobia bacterium]|nr:class I SAM-dependent methyltransferase [Elusimicrobiota bacterium]